MKKLAAITLAAGLLLGATGCSTPAPAPEPTQTVSNQQQRYENCIKGVTENYRIKYGEREYRANETKVNREVEKYCTDMNRK